MEELFSLADHAAVAAGVGRGLKGTWLVDQHCGNGCSINHTPHCGGNPL